MSDTPMIERTEVGKTRRLIPEFPPIPPPKKITEGDIYTAVEDVIREAREQRLSPTATTYVESADVTTLSRLENLVPEKARQVLGLSVKKAALTTASLYLLISSACGNVENPSIIPINAPELTPVVIQSPLVVHGQEQGVSLEDYIQQKLTSVLDRFSLELELTGIDFDKEVTLDEVEQIAKGAIPYLAEELQVERIHVPSIKWGKRSSYHYNPIFRTDKIEVGGGPLFMKKTSVIHELVHAQKRTKPRVGNWIVSPRDEVFAETVAWAVLAKQALNGDLLAKYALTMEVLCNLNALRGKGESPECYGNVGSKPVIMVMDALNGKSSSYGNVRLDGIVEFIKKDVLETNSK